MLRPNTKGDKVMHFQQPLDWGCGVFSLFWHGFGPRNSDTVKLNDAKIHKFKLGVRNRRSAEQVTSKKHVEEEEDQAH